MLVAQLYLSEPCPLVLSLPVLLSGHVVLGRVELFPGAHVDGGCADSALLVFLFVVDDLGMILPDWLVRYDLVLL